MTGRSSAFSLHAMACPICGERCRCTPAKQPVSRSIVLVDPEEYDPSEQQFASSLEDEAPSAQEIDSEPQQLAGASLAAVVGPENATTDLMENSDVSIAVAHAEDGSAGEGIEASDDDPELWKDQVASRIRSYKAKRHRRAGQGSLRLSFESTTGNHVFLKPEYPFDVGSPAESPEPLTGADTGTIVAHSPSNAATALQESPPEVEPEAEESEVAEEAVPPSRPQRGPVPEQGKLIEFPRPSYMTHAVTELAEPVPSSPRILDVPESVPLAPPPLDGLRLEAPLESSNQPMELPLQVASVSRRILAASLDAAIVLAGAAAFVFIALRTGMGPLLPDKRTSIAMALRVPAMLWILYQYLFLVYAAITPGMQLTRLRILHFEGKPVIRRLRQYRALMLLVSCCPAGLGFLWAFYDPDTLCWHDRITRTYVASRAVL